MIRILAAAAGGAGMVGGQVLDLEAERGSFLSSETSKKTEEIRDLAGCKIVEHAVRSTVDASGTDSDSSSIQSLSADSGQNDSNQTARTRVVQLSQIHKMKTGALIAGALELGAVSAMANEESRTQLRKYGHCIGLAFQIADDLLDVTGDQSKLGKTPGRDIDLGKLTYPSLLGIDNSRNKAKELVQEACQAVDVFGDRGVWLKDLARFIVERDH
jgi:geranylgeranyl diphosphate synthase type II